MKKVISAILIITIVVLSFVGCSNNNSKENSDKQSETEFSLKNTYDSVYSNEDESVLRFYDSLCNAVINGDTKFRISNSILDGVLQLFYTSFPMSFLVKNITMESDNSGVIIQYKNDLDAHKKKVEEFSKKIKAMQDACGYSTVSDNVYVLNVYNYLSSNLKISDNTSVSTYETIINDEGNVFTYANVFEYLLRQKGIEAYHILAEDASKVAWGLSMAKINNQLYYFDIGSEYYSNGGKQLEFFAMNTKDLNNEGLKNPKYSNNVEAVECDNNEFDACRSCKKWELNGSTLIINKYDKKVVNVNLQ